MGHVTLILPAQSSLRWHAELAAALERAGHRVSKVAGKQPSSTPGLRAVLAFERKVFRRGTWLADTVSCRFDPPFQKQISWSL